MELRKKNVFGSNAKAQLQKLSFTSIYIKRFNDPFNLIYFQTKKLSPHYTQLKPIIKKEKKKTIIDNEQERSFLLIGKRLGFSR